MLSPPRQRWPLSGSSSGSAALPSGLWARPGATSCCCAVECDAGAWHTYCFPLLVNLAAFYMLSLNIPWQICPGNTCCFAREAHSLSVLCHTVDFSSSMCRIGNVDEQLCIFCLLSSPKRQSILFCLGFSFCWMSIQLLSHPSFSRCQLLSQHLKGFGILGSLAWICSQC